MSLFFSDKRSHVFMQPNASSDDDVTAVVGAAVAGDSKMLDLLIEVFSYILHRRMVLFGIFSGW